MQHVVAHIRLEVLTELSRVPLYLHEQGLVLGLDIEVGEYADNDKNRQHCPEGQFETDFVSQHKSPPGCLLFRTFALFRRG
jgi:hypothetical protein